MTKLGITRPRWSHRNITPLKTKVSRIFDKNIARTLCNSLRPPMPQARLALMKIAADKYGVADISNRNIALKVPELGAMTEVSHSLEISRKAKRTCISNFDITAVIPCGRAAVAQMQQGNLADIRQGNVAGMTSTGPGSPVTDLPFKRNIPAATDFDVALVFMLHASPGMRLVQAVSDRNRAQPIPVIVVIELSGLSA